MLTCYHCGKTIGDTERRCPFCGAVQPTATERISDTGSILWGILGFFFPVVGLVVYLAWRNAKPNNAQTCALGAVLGVIVWVFLRIFIPILLGIPLRVTGV
ncbi:MAG: zinc ribbon domain-containing protein [Clostridiales bacterium]|nr:zinc ribbon domain-containing protein [Clostridiales bacterium]